jgi:hypothetical protein
MSVRDGGSPVVEELRKKIKEDRELEALKKLKEIQTDKQSKMEIQSLIDKRIDLLTKEE